MRLATPGGTPEWNEGREHRLLASFLAATLIVALTLSVLRLPVIPDFTPLIELVVRIVQPDAPPDEVVVPEPVFVEPTVVEEELDVTEPAMIESGVEDVAPSDRASASAPATVITASPNRGVFDARVQQAINDALEDSEYPPQPNPVFAEKRRDFEGRYRPPTREGKRPIWENIEKDQLGRSVLRSGNCWKVLDDPNVGSQEQFQLFGQFMVTCTYQPRTPQLLPWVPEIVARYPYLRDPDGYVKGIDDPATLAVSDPDPWAQRE